MRRLNRWASVGAFLLAVGLTYGIVGGAIAHSTPPVPKSTTATAPCAKQTATYTHVLVWVLENHSFSQARGHMPYLDSVANKCAYLTHESAISHPSLPNYLALTAGSTFGITDDSGPSAHKLTANSIFQELGTHWGSYHQSMSTNCKLSDGNHYIVHHNPAAYYTNIRTACNAQDVPYTKLATALASPATFPKYAFVVPDNCHNGHKNTCPGGDTLDGQAKQADDYLKAELPKLLSSATYQDGHLLIMITFDEGHSSNVVYTVLVGPTLTPGTVIGTTLTHYSLLRYAQAKAGVPCLLASCSAPVLTGPGL